MNGSKPHIPVPDGRGRTAPPGPRRRGSVLVRSLRPRPPEHHLLGRHVPKHAPSKKPAGRGANLAAPGKRAAPSRVVAHHAPNVAKSHAGIQSGALRKPTASVKQEVRRPRASVLVRQVGASGRRARQGLKSKVHAGAKDVRKAVTELRHAAAPAKAEAHRLAGAAHRAPTPEIKAARARLAAAKRTARGSVLVRGPKGSGHHASGAIRGGFGAVGKPAPPPKGRLHARGRPPTGKRHMAKTPVAKAGFQPASGPFKAKPHPPTGHLQPGSWPLKAKPNAAKGRPAPRRPRPPRLPR